MGRPALQPEHVALLFELTRALGTRVGHDELLRHIVTRTKEVLEAESCAILQLDEGAHELFFAATSDVGAEAEGRCRRIRLPADRGVAGWVVRHGTPALVPDATRDARCSSEIDGWSGQRTHDLLCVPLRARRGIIGLVGLRNKRVGAFTQDDLAFVDALAGPLAIAVENARLSVELRRSHALLQAEGQRRGVTEHGRYEEIVGTSPALMEILGLVETAIGSVVTVLLEGETGTGKELVARLIHARGPRRARPFIPVNCGALSETLLESELFGHRKGSFTGAVADTCGLLEVADGGTLFLDEVGEASASLQVRLLRFLQDGEVRRIGETALRRVDVRVIAGTNHDLAWAVRQQRFREDLYYRLRVFPIRIPTLRERREDIPMLATHFLALRNAAQGKRVVGIAPEALGLLQRYPWPGNIRELENEIERAVALVPDGDPITPRYLSEGVAAFEARRFDVPVDGRSLRGARAAFERQYLAEALSRNDGNATRTARMLGLSRQKLQKKIKDYGLRHR